MLYFFFHVHTFIRESSKVVSQIKERQSIAEHSGMVLTSINVPIPTSTESDEALMFKKRAREKYGYPIDLRFGIYSFKEFFYTVTFYRDYFF